MSITYEQLSHLNLTRLNQAVTAWKEVVRKVKELDDSHGPQVQKPFDAAGWTTTGPINTAEYAAAEVRRAGREAGDALKEARAIKSLLTDARDQLKAQQKKLHDYVQEVTSNGKVRVSERGRVTFTESVVGDPDLQGQPGYGQAVAAEERRIDEITGEIEKILKAAAQIDDSAAAALRYNVGNDKDSFNQRATGNTDKAEGRYDAARATQLAQKGEDMSNSELREFNGLLKEHKNEKDFSERFATRMGGRGTLDFWEGMDLHSKPAPEGTRKELLEETRKQLGGTLATATESNSKEMKDWKSDVIAAGPDHVGDPNRGPYGYQVMSDLMNSGRYDKDFLADYGNSLIAFEKDKTKNGMPLDDLYVGDLIPGSGGPGASAIDLRNDWGTDPMAGYMDALGHNHQASTEFFSDSKNFDYTTGAEDLKDANGKQIDTRDWPEDAHPQYDSGNSKGYDALGHALESATTGSDYGTSKPELHRGAEERAVMQQVMERYGDPKQQLMDTDKQPGISDSMGRIGAAYIDDLNYSLSEVRAGNAEARGMEDLFGAKDENKMAPNTTKQFIRELGGDKDSHHIMSQAQQAFTTSRIHAHEGSGEAYRAAEWGLTMHGALDEARAEAIGEHHRKSDKAYQQEMLDSLAWQQAGVSVAVGTATSIAVPEAAPVLVPIAADAAGTVTEAALGNEIRASLVAHAQDSRGTSIDSIDGFEYEAERMARTGIDNYMNKQGVEGTLRDDRDRELNDAYDRGKGLTDTDNSQ